MSFPSSPNVGDSYTTEDTTYVFNGVSWDRTVIGSGNRTNYAHHHSDDHHSPLIAALTNRIAVLESQSLLLLE